MKNRRTRIRLTVFLNSGITRSRYKLKLLGDNVASQRHIQRRKNIFNSIDNGRRRTAGKQEANELVVVT